MTGIRADANERVATGHIMRCITIARELLALGEEILFFVADAYAVPLLLQAGMPYQCLHTQWDRPEEELPVLVREIKKAGCHKLLVDSYQATAEYLGVLAKECKIIYIDDMFEERYPVDMIINYNAYHTRFPYEKTYSEKTRLLLGSRFVPLRKEFARKESTSQEQPHRKQAVWNIFLSCGGGDVHNALGGILEQAMNQKQKDFWGESMVFHTIVGGFHQQVARLEELAAKHPEIRLHQKVSNMAGIMSQCDIAVSAAGTVLYELCAMQVPTVFFVCAENQKYDSEFFALDDRMIFAGDIRSSREACIGGVWSGIRKLIREEGLRQAMRKKLGEVTDGKGAGRIAEAIRSM